MPLIADAPYVRLLLLMEAIGRNDCDFMADAGTDKEVTVRHSRNRKPVRGEVPALTLIFVSDDAEPAETGHTQDEIVRNMTVDVQVDVGTASEDSALDPTGLGLLSRIIAVFMRELRREDGVMLTFCDWIVPGDVEPDERSTPDQGRLVRSLNVLYRVLARDENVLLASGENG